MEKDNYMFYHWTQGKLIMPTSMTSDEAANKNAALKAMRSNNCWIRVHKTEIDSTGTNKFSNSLSVYPKGFIFIIN